MHGEPKLNQDVEVIERAIIYDAQTGEIVGSHTFGASGQLSEAGRQRIESLLQGQLADLEQRHGRKLAVHRSPEASKLTALHHRVDVSTGRLIELPKAPGRTKVE